MKLCRTKLEEILRLLFLRRVKKRVGIEDRGLGPADLQQRLHQVIQNE